jgi:uncharacterized protein with FMN-binding domain
VPGEDKLAHTSYGIIAALIFSSTSSQTGHDKLAFMKKFVATAFVVICFALYSLHGRRADGVAIVPPVVTSEPASTPATTAQPTSTPAVTPTPTATPSGQYKDGQYTGPSENAYYGFVQVKATISAGKLASVQFLQYPNDNPTSQSINSQAIPYLQQEAIQAQSANVDVISGATFTSQAFTQSLSSALSSAKS